jgi:hypothetical protein
VVTLVRNTLVTLNRNQVVSFSGISIKIALAAIQPFAVDFAPDLIDMKPLFRNLLECPSNYIRFSLNLNNCLFAELNNQKVNRPDYFTEKFLTMCTQYKSTGSSNSQKPPTMSIKNCGLIVAIPKFTKTAAINHIAITHPCLKPFRVVK